MHILDIVIENVKVDIETLTVKNFYFLKKINEKKFLLIFQYCIADFQF